MTSASTTPKSDGLSAAQIRALIALREEKIEEIATSVQVDPKRISETIDRRRRNERIRQKLCTHLNLSYERLWGSEQQANGREVVTA